MDTKHGYGYPQCTFLTSKFIYSFSVSSIYVWLRLTMDECKHVYMRKLKRSRLVENNVMHILYDVCMLGNKTSEFSGIVYASESEKKTVFSEWAKGKRRNTKKSKITWEQFKMKKKIRKNVSDCTVCVQYIHT